MDIWNQDKLFLFLAFFIPGIISIKVYNLLIPTETKTANQNILNAITYSCINYALLSWLIYIDIHNKLYMTKPLWHAIILITALFIFPILLALGFWALRKAKFISKHLPDPTPTPWDFSFSKRKGKVKKPYWIIIELNDGKRIGGIYGKESAASVFPKKEQIFLQKEWEIQGGKFIKPVERSKGVLVSGEQIKSIQFFE